MKKKIDKLREQIELNFKSIKIYILTTLIFFLIIEIITNITQDKFILTWNIVIFPIIYFMTSLLFSFTIIFKPIGFDQFFKRYSPLSFIFLGIYSFIYSLISPIINRSEFIDFSCLYFSLGLILASCMVLYKNRPIKN